MAVSKRTWITVSGEIRTAFVVRYRDADKKVRLETFERERDAKARDAQIAVDLQKGIHRPLSTSITISEAAALWLERAVGEKLERSTIESYEGHVRLHINPAVISTNVPNAWRGKLGDVKLSRLTTPVCVTFQRQLLTISSLAMTRKILKSFKAILHEAQQRGLIAYNSAESIRVKTKTRDKAPFRIGVQIPDKPDVRAILAASPDDFLPLCTTAAFTGMRSSELRALTWKNVDLDARVIYVGERADRQGVIGSCKSLSAYREIQIPSVVVDKLRAWQPHCPDGELKLVFPNGAGNVQSHSNIVHRRWYAVQRQLGMTRANGQAKYGFHSLRHFYASIMIEQGTPPKRLQSLLGHATLAMTMDTYGHLFPPGDDETTRINNAAASVLTPKPKTVARLDCPVPALA